MILTPFLHLKYQVVRGEATSMNKNNLNALKCYTSQNRVCTQKNAKWYSCENTKR